MVDDVIDGVLILYIAVTFAFGRYTNDVTGTTSVISHCILFYIMELFNDASSTTFLAKIKDILLV